MSADDHPAHDTPDAAPLLADPADRRPPGVGGASRVPRVVWVGLAAAVLTAAVFGLAYSMIFSDEAARFDDRRPRLKDGTVFPGAPAADGPAAADPADDAGAAGEAAAG